MNDNGSTSHLSAAAKRELLARLLAERGAGVLPAAGARTADARRSPSAIARRVTSEPRPLSFAQHRLWFFDKLTPGTAVYNIHVGLRLTGPLDAAILSRALRTIVQRHESLRTRFVEADGVPVQVIEDGIVPSLDVTDLRAFPAADREAEARRLAEAHAERPFDITQAPLFRAALVRLADDIHVLLLTMHHLVSDGLSTAIVLRELTAVYEQERGIGRPLPELPVQYGDFAEWQRSRMTAGEGLDRQLAFWKEKLAGDLPVMDLPADAPRRATQTFRGGTHAVLLPAALVAELRTLGRAHGATLFMTLLAAFQLLLSRLSGQEDVIVGSPVAGRSRAECEPLIGCFINTVALRTDAGGNPAFLELLQRVRTTALEAYANQDVPFDKVIEELRPPRDGSRTPVFQVLFNMLGAGNAWNTRWDDVVVAAEPPLEEPSKFDLTMYAGESGDTVYLRAVYNADLFGRSRIEALTAQLVFLLQQIAADPSKPIGSYSLVTPDAESLLPDPVQPISAAWDGSVVERVVACAQSAPSRVAIVHGADEWTYAQLESTSADVATRLCASGIGTGDVVAIYARRAPELVAAMLGVWRCGAAFLVLDAAYPAARLAEYLLVAQPKALISIGQDTPDALATACASMDASFVLRGTTADAAPPLSVRPAGPEDLAYVSFTSGSTGTPKGILGTHRPVAHFVRWHTETFGFGPDDRFAMLSGLAHDPLLRDVFTPLSIGASLRIPDEGAFDSGERLAGWLRRERVTVAHLTPSLGQLVCQGAADRPPLSLRYAFFGGEPLTTGDVDALKLRAPSVQCVNFYGATETPQAVAFHVVPADVPATAGSSRRARALPVGTGIEGVQLLLLNEAGNLAGIGELAEICVRTPYLARGYVGGAAVSDDRFAPNPLSADPDDRLYRTRDAGRYGPDGLVQWHGRTDRQLKLRGFRIEPGDIESAIARHQAIRQAHVVLDGEQDGRPSLVAYCVASGAAPTAVELRTWLRTQMPEYMVPSGIVFLDALPLTPNGKVDRRRLPAPMPQQSSATRAAPLTPIEEALADVWRGLLRVDSIAADDSFFDLGGHSLIATLLASRIRDLFGVELPLRRIFDAPTLGGMALEVGQLVIEAEKVFAPEAGRRVAISRRAGGDSAPLSFAQQRLWFLEQLQPGNASYNINGAARLTGVLNEEALRSSIDTIVARHESLRTCFGMVDGEPVQRVLPPEALALEVVDLTGVPVDVREAQALRLVSEAAERPFDLSAGPLFRTQLLRLGPADNVLAVTLHHIVSDAWSLGVFVRELGALYAAHVDGRQSPLEPLPIQYGDYAAWQRASNQQGASGADVDYWKARLAGPLPVLDLPVDRRRPAVLSYRGATASFEWPSHLLAAIRQLSLQTGGTLFTTLMAGYNALLARYSRQDDVLVGFPVAGRNRAELEPLIGFFVNMLVLRTDAAGDPTFKELLGRVREGALDAFAHQEMPFDKLVEVVQPAREMGRHPLFQAGFALQNAPSPGLELPGITWSPLVVSRTRARFDLHVAMWEDEGRLAGTIEYSTDLFDAGTIERFASHFRHLMEAGVADPDARLSALPIASDAERQAVAEWTATAREYPGGSTIADEFERRAAETPDAVAVSSGSESLTYAALNARANGLAHHLRSLGVGPDVLVGVCLERSVDLVVTLVAILKAGGAYVPLDSSYPRERLAFMIEDTALRFAVTAGRFVPELPLRAGCTVVCLDLDEAAIALAPSANLQARSTADHLAYVIYTSGSTGRPKGVEVTHRGVLRLVRGASYVPFDSRAVFLLLAPVSFDASTFEVWGALLNGARCVVFPDMLPTTEALGRVLADEGVTVLWLTASLFNAIVDDDPRVLAPVEQLLIGGEALSPSHVRRAYDALPRVRIVNGYGPTESTTFTCCHGIPRELPDELTSIPIGAPIANTRVHVVDSRFELQAPGVPGELCVGGDGLARGYLHRPDLTAERFVPDPFGGNGGRLYRTGDLVRWLGDGTIEFLGRLDEQVKIRGFRIEPGEIEAVLRQHPAVSEAVVLVRESVATGKRLVAWVVASDDTRGNARQVADAVREHARTRLPEYMVPSAIVVLDAMPLTPNGKLDRDRLPEPEPERGAGREYVAPRNEIEERIAAVWSAVLNVESVGADDNFFDLGGHSLLLVKVHRQLRERLPREISVVDLFQFPTVGALARHVAGDAPEADAVGQPASRRDRTDDDAIAIVGMAGRFPGAPTVARFWENLAAGVESVSFFSDEELSAAGVSEEMLRRPEYVKARAIVDGHDEFDAGLFGYNPREAALIDPQQRVFLECAWEALEDAATDPERFDGSIGVYAGVGMNTYAARLLASPEAAEAVAGIQFAVSSDKDFLATRVSYKLNLRGPSVNVQTACSTSLVAVHLACRGLLDGDCDMALAGGVRIAIPQAAGYLFQQGSILSPDGHCRAFDHRAAGTVSGNGAGVVVLKRLRDALASGDHVYAVIKGTAINNDGSLKVGFTAPGVDGQADVIRRAQLRAGVDPSSIGYVEAHGTGTSLGDPVEIAALTKAFRAGTADTGFCAIGSLKSSVGHLDAAAGVAGLMKAALCLRHRLLPPTLNFERANPAIDFDGSPFVVNTTLREWPAGAVPRRAGVSAFGLGGTNAHAVLEEAPPVPTSGEARPAQVIVVSARSPEALDSAALNLAAHLESHPGLNIADVAFTTQVGRRQFEHRRAVVCTDTASAVVGLRAPRDSRAASRAGGQRSLAFMFTGQGSQQVNMMRGLYESEPVFRRELDACAERFDGFGIGLRSLLYPDAATEAAAARLESTAIAQPALFAVELALAQLWRSWGVVPDAMIGHSIGEYVAACLAGVLSVDDATALVAARGRLMQAAEPGAMVAVPLGEAELARYVDGRTVSVAAVNGASSCVASGTFAAVESLVRVLGERGIECQRLRTSHAFHSPMMEPALEPFRQAVRQVRLQEPLIPYVSNVTGTWITAADATDPEYWVRHLRGTVRFHDGIATVMQRAGCVLLEVGPGHTLASLARASARTAGVEAIASVPRGGDDDSAAIMGALGRLWVAGVEVDWMQVHGSQRRRRVPQLPAYPFERQRYWIDVPGHGTAPAPARLPVEKWFYTPAWTTAIARPEVADKDIPAGAWVVFADSYGVGESIVKALREKGALAIRVVAGQAFARTGTGEYAVRPEEPADYDALFADLRRAGADLRRIVNAWALEADAASAAGRGTFYSSLYLAQCLGRHFPGVPVQLGIIASEAHEIVGGEQANPSSCMALWPIRVLPLEYPHVTCVAVDLDDPAAGGPADAELVIREMAGPREAPLVGLRNGRRWVQEFRQLPLDMGAQGPAPFRAGGVYLVTGGTGGVGIELARHLAETAKARIALVSRTAVPERQQWHAWIRQHGEDDPGSRTIRQIESIEALGGDVLTLQADAADEEQMRAAVDATIDRFGALHGVFVAAGADKTARAIEETTREQCEAQFRSRADAVEVLDRVLGDRRLDFCLLDSSLSTVLGAAGFAAYTAAHLFVDAYAARRNRRGGTPWIAVDWDNWTTWKTPASLGPASDAGYRMQTADALAALDRVLAQRSARHLIVSTGDLRSRLAAPSHTRSASKTAVPVQEHSRPALDTPFEAPRTETERLLAEIWQDLLGIDRVGVNDNFFSLGGDSVVGIQVVARAAAAGVRLTTKDAFARQTIAELAEAARGTAAPAAPQAVVAGRVPLTPIESWLFDQDLAEVHHFNQSVLLDLDPAPAPATLERAAAAIAAHHDALRLRFTRSAGGWEQHAGNDARVPVSVFDLSELDRAAQADAVQREAAALQRSLDLEAGPIVRLGLFDRGPGRPAQLFVVAHHLVVDAISWRILLEDLRTACEHAGDGEIRLAAATTPFQVWARALSEHAASDEARREVDFWTAQPWREAVPIPVEGASGDNTVGSVARLATTLGEEETSALLTHAPDRLSAQPNELLLASLCRAVGAWTGGASVLVDVEGHGREPMIAGIDLSRTVGWFTAIFPLLLESPRDASAPEILDGVRRRFRDVPHGGLGFGVLRYLSPDAAVRQRMQELPRPEISFLYMGRTDQRGRRGDWMQPARETAGGNRSARARRRHAIEVEAAIVEGRLQMTWIYSGHLHREDRIEKLSSDCTAALRELIAAAPAARVASTPADFPAARLDQRELDRLLSGLTSDGSGRRS